MGQLLDANVVAILPAFDQLVALTMQGHGADGSAVEVHARADGFDLGRAISLPAVPHVGVVDHDGTILLATSGGLLRLARGLRLAIAFETSGWMTSASNMVVDADGTVYVGMRGVVVEVRLSASPPTETWLFPF